MGPASSYVSYSTLKRPLQRYQIIDNEKLKTRNWIEQKKSGERDSGMDFYYYYFTVSSYGDLTILIAVYNNNNCVWNTW